MVHFNREVILIIVAPVHPNGLIWAMLLIKLTLGNLIINFVCCIYDFLPMSVSLI